MALVAEDGTGLANASTWATRAELIAFGSARGIVIPDADASDVYLVKAMDRLTIESFRGEPVNADQGTPFPRVWIDPETEVEGFPSDSVPAPLKRAQLLFAIAAQQGVELMGAASAGERLKRRKVGPMEREFFDAPVSMLAQVAGVSELIRPYLDGDGGFDLTVQRK
jgi:hypothetical protein